MTAAEALAAVKARPGKVGARRKVWISPGIWLEYHASFDAWRWQDGYTPRMDVASILADDWELIELEVDDGQE